jgi:hypothetical protein
MYSAGLVNYPHPASHLDVEMSTQNGEDCPHYLPDRPTPREIGGGGGRREGSSKTNKSCDLAKSYLEQPIIVPRLQ